MNNSTASTCSHLISTPFVAFTSIISLVAFIGNFLVSVTFLKTPSLRTSTNYYIVNLAVSDILCISFTWLLYTAEGLLTSRVFVTDPTPASIMCKLGMYFRGVSQVVSVLSLVAIAVDRYIAIVFPLKTAVVEQGKVRVINSLMAWIIPVFYGIPCILFAEVARIDNHTFCRLLWSELAYTIFNAAGFVMFYCIPAIMIIILYASIVKTLSEKPSIEDEMQGTVKYKRQKQHRKATKIFVSIVFGFFVCWTPLCIYLVLKIFHPLVLSNDRCHIMSALFFYVFPSLSTAINPVVLFLFSTNYRKALVNLCSQMRVSLNSYSLRRPFRSNRVVPSHTGTVQMIEIH